MYNARLGARRQTDGPAVLALLASAGRGGGWRWMADGGGWTAVGTPGSDGWNQFAHFGTSRNHPLWKWQCVPFVFQKWPGAENTRMAAPPITHRLHMSKNTRPDAISRPQSPQSVVNSCQNPSLQMTRKPRKKPIKNNFAL